MIGQGHNCSSYNLYPLRFLREALRYPDSNGFVSRARRPRRVKITR